MNRQRLLDEIRSARASLDEALTRIADDRLDTVSERSGQPWSGTEQLAHITAWHRVAIGRLTGATPDEITKRAANGEYAEGTLDDLNERFHERDRDLPAADARVAFEDTYAELVAAVEGMSDADLAAPWLDGHPERGTYAQMIQANTSEHYEEHLPALRALAAEE